MVTTWLPYGLTSNCLFLHPLISTYPRSANSNEQVVLKCSYRLCPALKWVGKWGKFTKIRGEWRIMIRIKPLPWWTALETKHEWLLNQKWTKHTFWRKKNVYLEYISQQKYLGHLTKQQRKVSRLLVLNILLALSHSFFSCFMRASSFFLLKNFLPDL